jgi:hypothetical protein
MRALQVRVQAGPIWAYAGVVAQRLLQRDSYPCSCLTVGN